MPQKQGLKHQVSAAPSSRATSQSLKSHPSPASCLPSHTRLSNMPTITQNKDRSTSNSNTSSPNPGSTTRPNTRRNGPPPLLEDHQDVKDPLEGWKYLEKYSLLCPPGEPPTHQSLTICLHQISALAGVPKQAVNAIRSVAFLLGELEDSQINITVRDALDSQMTEFTSDFKMLIEDAKERIDEHAKASEKRLASLAPPPHRSQDPSQAPTHRPWSTPLHTRTQRWLQERESRP